MSDFKIMPNPQYDPEKPFGPDNFPDMIDPTTGLALEFGRIELEYLRETGGSLNECLRVIALHRLAPPEWLAERMLAELPNKPRENGLMIDRIVGVAQEADRLKREEGLDKYQQAERLGMSHATLSRWRTVCKRWRQFQIERME